jgi:hypothetical protein
MAYSRTRYGTGYYIYHRYVPGAKLSRPIETWDPKMTPDKRALDAVDDAVNDPGADYGDAAKEGHVALAANTPVTLVGQPFGPTVIRQLAIILPKGSAAAAAGLRLRITWDDRPEPSVDAPLPLFFGAGTLYNRDGRDFLVKSLPMTIACDKSSIALVCKFPMPFFRSARIQLLNHGPAISGVRWKMRTEPLRDPPNHVAYFHATYRDHPTPDRGKDLILLNTRDIEGSRDWTGSFVGTSLIFSHNANLTTLEGDPRFFFDDSQTPQGQGTGTEEWGGGGDYWGGRNMSLPFAGHPCGAPSLKEAKCDDDKIESAYRFLLADLFPFGKNARIQLEHGGTNESTEHYETVTYWYGLPGASLVQSDELKIGDAASERSHDYDSPDASQPQPITSRYEWGVDRLKDVEIYPAHTEIGRTTTEASQFTLKINPDNWGVMLRRTFDYQYPNQRAEVSVETKDGWRPAGVWYTAGSNTCVYSNPKEELGATQHVVQTSNRRFRDDEFLIGRDLTRGREAIGVRVKFTPVKTPLFPGHPLPPRAWCEIRYAVYCFVMPAAPPP